MNYSEINEIIKNLLGQLQDLKPQLELARGKEAWVMQEDQDSEIVEEASKEAFNKFLRIIGSAQKNAHRLFDIIPNPLIENILGNLWSLDQPLSAVCFMDNNTGQASLQEGYIEDYINCKKDALTTLRQLSQELSEISPPLVIWQNIISEIRSIGSQSATHKYSRIEGPLGPYNKIREEIAGLLNDIESAQKICIQVSENATTALVKLHHRVSDTKDLVNRNFCKGETPPQKLKSIQDDLSQAFKKIEMEYRDLLEEFAVEFEVAHIKFVKSAEAEQSSSQKPAGKEQETEENIFRKDGDKWIVVFNHSEPCYLNDIKGMEQIAQLLAKSPKSISAIELANPKNDTKLMILSKSDKPQEIIDKNALQSYRIRLRDIEDELAGAEKNNDLAEQNKLKAEKEQILSYVQSTTKPSGQSGSFSDNIKNACDAVSNNINRALEKIKQNNPTLHQHLNNSIQRGKHFAYNPDRKIDWEL